MAMIRRLWCDADIIPVVLDDARRRPRRRAGQAGRHPRAAAGAAGDVPHLRPPRCTVGFDDCDIHHVHP